MPPRWLALGFVGFWIAMTSLFLWRDVLPRINPTEPLMFPVELIDEAGTFRNQNLYDVGWTVSKNGAGGYVANLEWNYHSESDSFDSHCTLRHGEDKEKEAPRSAGAVDFPQIHDVEMDSHYLMLRKGKMHSFQIKSQYNLVAEQPRELLIPIRFNVEGVPSDRQVVPQRTLSLARAKSAEFLPPLEERAAAVIVGERQFVLNPLHPVRHFPALQADQHWLVTMIDPLAAFSSLPRTLGEDLLPSAHVKTAPAAFLLEARVQRDEEIFFWEDKKEEVPCRIIRIGQERSGDDGGGLSMKLWVAVRDGLVMKQEANLMGDSWVMERRRFPTSRSPVKKITPTKP